MANAPERSGREPSPVRILVVVASIQTRTLKAEAAKGFTRTKFGRESVGPKPAGKFRSEEGGRVEGDLHSPRPPPGEREQGQDPLTAPRTRPGRKIWERRRERPLRRPRMPPEGFSPPPHDGRRRQRNPVAGRSCVRIGRALRHPERRVRMRRPLKIRASRYVSRAAVPITASGLRGEQPLADRIM